MKKLKTAVPQFAIWCVILVIASATTSAVGASNQLINVDFGSGVNSLKVGTAAAGAGSGDYWNLYTRDDGVGGWRTFGALTGLRLADGTVTRAGLTVANAPGAWGNGSADPMYDGYIYPFDGGNITVLVTNLAAGAYDVYVYASDLNCQLQAGGVNYGSKTSQDNAPGGVPVWQEGRQYVRYQGVSVGSGQSLTLTVRPGLSGYAIISGLQLAFTAPVPPPPAAFLVDVDFGEGFAGSAKVGLAATGQTTNDFWNFYTRDDGAGGWLTFGAVAALKNVSGTPTAVGMTVANAPGAWGTASSDAMYVGYLYPFSGVATVTVTNLPAGSYDFYLYSPDGNYQVMSGGVNYGVKACVDLTPTVVPAWQEGLQYARYRNVAVNPGQPVVITVQPGVSGYAAISGLQIAQASEMGGVNHHGSLSLHCKSGECVWVHFSGVPMNRYQVEASLDLKHWVHLGSAVADNNGNCEFEDRDSKRFPHRYYRIVAP